jgi:ComF family protein
VCGAGLVSVEETWHGLCESCSGPGLALTGERCDYCGKPLISEHGRCLACRTSEKRAFDRITALFPYSGKYRRLLRAYKFGKNLAVGNFFAECIGAFLDALDVPERPVIVPVPHRHVKIKTSGWDQVEYLARLLERERTVSRCLRRLPSKIQKKLGREDRKTNLQGRIILRKKAPAAAVLVDDVMTTGFTMDVCAAALKAGGAEKVYGICLFYN